MTDNVVKFPGNGTSPQELIDKMVESGVEQCVAVGITKHGSIVLGTTQMEIAEAIFALRAAETVMMDSVL